MPWDSNNSGGPWGQGPNRPNGGGPRRPSGGGSGGGGNGPNLEELFSRGREQFSGQVPGGTRLWIVVIVLGVIGIWGWNSVRFLSPQELGMRLTFGKPDNVVLQEGMNFALWPIQTIETVNIAENQTNVASITNGRSSSGDGLMLSGDQNIVDVAFSVLWRVNDPRNFLFNVETPAEMVRQVADSAMREVVGRRPAREIFRDDRSAIADEVQQITQEILDSYEAGVTVTGITIPQAAPPAEVADAFDEVQRAQQDESRFQDEARRDANTRLGAARGQAAQIREEAAAYKDQVVKEAEGEAARFISVYEQYAKAPDVTRTRLYLETMEQVLGTSNKIILEGGEGTSGVVPYLPLNELRQNSSSSSQ
ncbi:MAG: FtsH protease activity modulator HflK [Hyphomicrobiaceae bacterium]|nr:FtsH protease activity modulator HflK [Hyphomicrobiaceae bacterium]MCC0024849.1 FtsH protease activity modulator HflK [Hyphomicrobiaceae bacterium]